MKSILFSLIIGLMCFSVSAQDISVAYLTEQKSNAEWLKSSAITDSITVPLNGADFQVVNDVADKLVVGRALSISGFILSPFYVGPLFTTLQGAFTRMPAHKKLSKFIKRKYNNTYLNNDGYADLNLQHLIKAKKYLGRGQKVSYISMGLTVVNIIVTTQFAKISEGNDQNKYLAYGGATFGLTNAVASGINLVLMNKAIRELRKVH